MDTSVHNVQSSHHTETPKRQSGRAWRVITVILLFSVTVLLIAITFTIYYGGSNETRYVKTKGIQVVSLANGNTYFGNISTLTDKYIILNSVFYMPAGSSTQVYPLSCQQGEPYNQMVINKDNVDWWGNLQSSSQVYMNITNIEKGFSSATCPPIKTPATNSTTPSSSTSLPATTNKQ